jgi:diguanylate cyclase (GGDEF)-like protein/PAS domain S-box-containing protein
MASGFPPRPPTDTAAAVNGAIEAWSVFEQFFVLSYRMAKGLPISVNELSVRSAAALGVSRDGIVGDSGLFARLLHPEDRSRVLSEHWDAAANGEPLVSEYRMVGKGGAVLWIYDNAVPIVGSDGTPTLYGHCLDITPLRGTEAVAGDAAERLSSVVANIPGVVYRCSCDRTGTIEFMSSQIEELAGYPASDFVGNKVRSYHSIIHPDDLPYVIGELGDALEQASAYSLEYRLISSSGEPRWVAEHGRPVFGPDGRGHWTAGVILDITRQKAAERSGELVERQLRRQALHDPVTGLPNRVLFHERVVQAISEAQRGDSELAVLVMNLDRFKQVNDSLGHEMGDQLLQEVAIRLQEVLREGDSTARFGSDEFGVIVLGARRMEVLEVVRRVREAIERSMDLGGLSVSVEVSIGIAGYPRDGVDAEALLRCADTAMHVAKDTKMGYAFYDASVDARASARLAMIGELWRAIEEHELVLHYQPKIAVRSGRVVGVEALVRWHDPGRGLVMPQEFIPVARETSLIKALTQHVLNEAGQQWRAWADEGRRLSVAVNLSMLDLVDPAFPGEVATLLGKWRMPATMLKLEVTESSIVDDPRRTEDVIERLGAMGLRLSVDDFGTGYSSIAYLKRLPIDEIKIDTSLVLAMVAREQDEVVVRSTIELGHNLGFSVVAEGVETRAIMERLAQLGCDFAQGYYVSRPVPPDELGIWFDEHPDAGEPVARKRKFREKPVSETLASA